MGGDLQGFPVGPCTVTVTRVFTYIDSLSVGIVLFTLHTMWNLDGELTPHSQASRTNQLVTQATSLSFQTCNTAVTALSVSRDSFPQGLSLSGGESPQWRIASGLRVFWRFALGGREPCAWDSDASTGAEDSAFAWCEVPRSRAVWPRVARSETVSGHGDAPHKSVRHLKEFSLEKCPTCKDPSAWHAFWGFDWCLNLCQREPWT